MAPKLSLHMLPTPLTFYVRINALSESHLRQVAKLKRVYGPDLLRDLSRESVAAQGEMSVEDLSFLIEGWKDRFQNAVSWWMERGTNRPNALPRTETKRFSGGAFIATCGTQEHSMSRPTP